MDTRWFQDFVTLAEVQNFTRAAEMRNVSQAAFSRRIQALEQWLGAKLIDRAAFPTRLTPAGERFRKIATGLLNQIADARAEISDAPSRNHVRIASTYALVSTRLPIWWPQWSEEGGITCSLEVGNVHDTVSAFNAGSADILIGFHQAAHPIQLDMTRFDRHELGVEKVRPYVSRALAESGGLALPGTSAKPVPLLMYSPSGYFARVVDSAIEQSPQPLFGYRAFEAEMTDVLGDLASQGMGIAWLPDSSFVSGRLADLVPVGDGAWDVEVSIVAYRSRINARAVVGRLWERICAPGARQVSVGTSSQLSP
ncbi:LysR family transcriptional regulator [Variovorax sp. PAMC26660]|uniref:LysR family transcriptional regulator n=1 Tax=Variovorax sp. PAMC26660 TaxID=2762322 RepID=UPI00164E0522|nr:LysR family transcriptional regulator [Variovorax sp. PAMC26660]QNK68826.1 LysR family transcriptional regulator [Variovorax sp. PAMC26660]